MMKTLLLPQTSRDLEMIKTSPLMADLLEFNNPTEVKPEIKLEPEVEEPEAEMDQETIHVCSKCDKCFTLQSQLEEHNLSEHGEETKPRVRLFCNELFTTQSALDEHKLHDHVDQKPNICQICYENFASPELLSEHSAAHHQAVENVSEDKAEEEDVEIYAKPFSPDKGNVSENLYMCGKCSKSFSTEDQLRDHCFIFASDCSLEDRSFVCPSCYMTFRDLDLYLTHCSKHMNVNKKHQCDQCDKSFARVALLNEHKRTHNSEHPFQCKECNKVFSRKSALMKHGRVHKGMRPYQCEICAKTFTEGSSLRTHLRIHTGEKPYQCIVCKFSFRARFQLTRHFRIHSGEKPFKCDICDKRFTHRAGLRSHKLVHTGEKPFQCDICKKAFAQKTNWLSHVMIHGGDKPYKCDQCDKAFVARSHLTLHVTNSYRRKTVSSAPSVIKPSHDRMG